MYSPDFDYYRAASVAEASDLLRKHPGAKILAGGHSLIPLLKFRLAAPPALIDIGRIAELKHVIIKDGIVRVGALPPGRLAIRRSEIEGPSAATWLTPIQRPICRPC
jgi:aerobic carbon-monoxide dehydrogenase medium subunit